MKWLNTILKHFKGFIGSGCFFLSSAEDGIVGEEGGGQVLSKPV